MRWALGCAFNLKDLFINFPLKKLKITCNKCYEIIRSYHRDLLVHRVFKEHVKMVINDVIENNITFELPLTGKAKADIHMLRIDGNTFKNLRKTGKWKDVDFLKSNFSAYLLGFFMYGNRTPRVKNIYVSRAIRDKITEYTNQGKTYC